MKKRYVLIITIIVILFSIKVYAAQINGFRIAFWDYTKPQVEKNEKAILIEKGDDYLYYIGRIYNYDCVVFYNFNDNKLIGGGYIIPLNEPYSSIEECEMNHQKIKSILIQKHANPTYEEGISREILINYFADNLTSMENIFNCSEKSEIWLDSENTASVVSLILEN